MPDGDGAALLTACRGPREAIPETSVHRLIEDRADATPDVIALTSDEGSMTLSALEARANKLAHFLVAKGTKRESLIGVHLRRAPRMPTAVLGVLKAGGAYLPLDASLPRERVARLVEQAEPQLVLTERALAATAPRSADLVVLEDVGEDLHALPPTRPGVEVVADQLAYVMFTSGSTGAPKGVMVPHRGVVNYLMWATRHYFAEHVGGAPVQSSLGFDLTVTALLAPLLVGQPVHLLAEGSRGLRSLLELLKRTPVAFVKLTPSHLQLISALIDVGQLRHRIGTLVIGGEALTVNDVQPWLEGAPETRLINEYGPTETVVGSANFEVSRTGEPGPGIPLGWPLANLDHVVLDGPGGRLSPPLTPGELHIAGAQVSRGYLNDPRLTADRFVPHPYPTRPGERIYRSGDLCRARSDGNLEFLGRTDQQIKLRGHRIDPAEIEAEILREPDVDEAVVILREDRPGDKRLCAYVVRRAGEVPSSRDLRARLGRRLPSHMVPMHVVAMVRLPLTSNGKLDRPALPAPALRGRR